MRSPIKKCSRLKEIQSAIRESGKGAEGRDGGRLIGDWFRGLMCGEGEIKSSKCAFSKLRLLWREVNHGGIETTENSF